MDMNSVYNITTAPVSGFLDKFVAAKKDAATSKFLPGAMQGNMDALNNLMRVNPDAGMKVSGVLDARAKQAAMAQQSAMQTAIQQHRAETGDITAEAALEKEKAQTLLAYQRLKNEAQNGGMTQTEFDKKSALFDKYTAMPEGKEKDALGMFIGAKGKSFTLEERLSLAQDLSGIKVGEAEKTAKIKGDQEIITEMRRQAETPEGQLKIAKLNMDLISGSAAKEASAYDAEDSVDLIDGLKKSDLGAIYGRGESVYPTLLRKQSGVDLFRQRERLKHILQVTARDKMIGQGAISNFESQMFADAATIIGDPDISPELAMKELDRVRPIFERVKTESNKAASAGRKEPAPDKQAEKSEHRKAIEWAKAHPDTEQAMKILRIHGDGK